MSCSTLHYPEPLIGPALHSTEKKSGERRKAQWLHTVGRRENKRSVGASKKIVARKKRDLEQEGGWGGGRRSGS